MPFRPHGADTGVRRAFSCLALFGPPAVAAYRDAYAFLGISSPHLRRCLRFIRCLELVPTVPCRRLSRAAPWVLLNDAVSFRATLLHRCLRYLHRALERPSSYTPRFRFTSRHRFPRVPRRCILPTYFCSLALSRVRESHLCYQPRAWCAPHYLASSRFLTVLFVSSLGVLPCLHT